jgi:hypothetical protein
LQREVPRPAGVRGEIGAIEVEQGSVFVTLAGSYSATAWPTIPARTTTD